MVCIYCPDVFSELGLFTNQRISKTNDPDTQFLQTSAIIHEEQSREGFVNRGVLGVTKINSPTDSLMMKGYSVKLLSLTISSATAQKCLIYMLRCH